MKTQLYFFPVPSNLYWLPFLLDEWGKEFLLLSSVVRVDLPD